MEIEGGGMGKRMGKRERLRKKLRVKIREIPATVRLSFRRRVIERLNYESNNHAMIGKGETRARYA